MKPIASIDAVNKIVSGKVNGYRLNKAYTTKSMYLVFDDPQNDLEFQIRASDHSKIDELYEDTVIFEDDVVLINIYSAETKKEAIAFLKEHFSKVKKLPEAKDVFRFTSVKKVLKTKYPAIVEDYLKKIKVDTSKTTKQVREQVLQKLIKMKPTGTLTKKEYAKSRGMFKFIGEKDYTGVITWIATTGNQVGISGEVGNNFSIKKDLHKDLLSFVKGNESALESYLIKQKK